MDVAATNFPELNFIVEHVGLPRIEDFCFMATQEPNVYAGLSVALGALMHSRPRFFSTVMGELLFWVGEDKMIWASDYAIWHPKWQVEMFIDWDYPGDHEYDDFPRLSTEGKKKIIGLNAARLYDIEVPAELQGRHRVMPNRATVLDALSGVRDPELDEPITDLRFVSSLEIEDGAVNVSLRLPTYYCAPNFAYLMVADAREALLSVEGVEEARSSWTTTMRRVRSTAALTGSATSHAPSPARPKEIPWMNCATSSAASPSSAGRNSSAGP